MIVLDPCSNIRAAVELERLAGFPAAIENAHIDVRALSVFARFAGIPGKHVTGGAYRPFGVEDRDQRFSIFKMDCLLQMFGNAAHVEGNDNSSAQTILIEQGRINSD